MTTIKCDCGGEIADGHCSDCYIVDLTDNPPEEEYAYSYTDSFIDSSVEVLELSEDDQEINNNCDCSICHPEPF